MSDVDNYGRFRAASSVSMDSSFGDEFIGVASQNRIIDEVCKKMSETKVEELSMGEENSISLSAVQRINFPGSAQNSDSTNNQIRNRASSIGRPTRSLSGSSTGRATRSLSISSLSRDRVHSDVLQILLDGLPSPVMFDDHAASCLSPRDDSYAEPVLMPISPSGDGLSTQHHAGAQVPSTQSIAAVAKTNGSAMSVIAARSTSAAGPPLLRPSNLPRRICSNSSTSSTLFSPMDEFLVTPGSSARSRAPSDGNLLFNDAMDEIQHRDPVFQSNSRPAWSSPGDNRLKRGRSASFASPTTQIERKIHRASSIDPQQHRHILALPPSGRPPIYKQVAPFYPTQTASVPTTNLAQQHGGRAFQRNMRLGRWSPDEQSRLREAIKLYGPDPKWRDVAELVGTRTGPQCSQHWHRNLAPNIAPRRRGTWITAEDNTLRSLIEQLGCRGPWPRVAEEMSKRGFQRTDKQCRERWQHHLDPSLRVGRFTDQEDQLLLQTYRECGNKWNWKRMKVALTGRTRDQVSRRLKALQKTMSSVA